MHAQRMCTDAMGSCELTLDWTFSTSAWGPGDHTITVKAVDQLDHQAQDLTWKVTVEDPTFAPVALTRDAIIYQRTGVSSAVQQERQQQANPTSCGSGDETGNESDRFVEADAPCSTLLYYVSDNTGQRYTHAKLRGCDAAHATNQGVRGYYILQFGATIGRQRAFRMSHAPAGTQRISFEVATDVVKAFAAGYNDCLASAKRDGRSKVTIAIGTTNDGLSASSDDPRGAQAGAYNGTEFAQLVRSLARYISGGHQDGRNWEDWIIVRGAIDIELSWSYQEAAKAFVDSYAQEWSGRLLSPSAIDGCPPSGSNCDARSNRPGCPQLPRAAPDSCTNHWTQSEAHYVMWGKGGLLPIPQTYVKRQPPQWRALSKYGTRRGLPKSASCDRDKRIRFVAPVTEHKQAAATWDRRMGWERLAETIGTDPCTRQSRVPFNVEVSAGW